MLRQYVQIGQKPLRLAPVSLPDARADDEAEHAEAVGVPVAVPAGQRGFALAHPPQSGRRNRRVHHGTPTSHEEQHQSAHVSRVGREHPTGRTALPRAPTRAPVREKLCEKVASSGPRVEHVAAHMPSSAKTRQAIISSNGRSVATSSMCAAIVCPALAYE